MLPLLTRDVKDAGLICQHCNDTLVPFDELPDSIRSELEKWADKYAPVHAVAHWDDRQRKTAGDYDRAFENAAEEAERLLAHVGKTLAGRPARILSGGRLGRSRRMPRSPAGGCSLMTGSHLLLCSINIVRADVKRNHYFTINIKHHA